MKDLIERLEKAEGPDRELDGRIHMALGAGGFESQFRFETFRDNIESWVFRSEIDRVCRNYGIPTYTASPDAALTLVPEGWCSLMAWNPTDAICSISIKPLGHIDNEWPGDGKAPTPALALCIAALKARIAVERDLTKMEAGK